MEENPTLAIRRDFDLIEWLDQLGFDEAWIGEHHSSGWEIISSPELFIAGVAERTERIRLGTGVISLPYHNPLMVADRIVQLDHQTRGRAIFGVGPGLLPGDARMLCLDPMKQRSRMVESLDVILRLLDGETVTTESEWFRLHEARCQLRPFSAPRPEIAVSSAVTPSGGELAGKHGLSMLCLAATDINGYNALRGNWEVALDSASRSGKMVHAAQLRLVGPMHIAETRDRARLEVQAGFDKWFEYMRLINPFLANAQGSESGLNAMVDAGQAVVGTPDDAIALINRLREQIPDFGTFLFMAHNWADFDHTKRSYELFARHVLPLFNHSNDARTASNAWASVHKPEFMAGVVSASNQAIEQHRAAHQPKKKHAAAE